MTNSRRSSESVPQERTHGLALASSEPTSAEPSLGARKKKGLSRPTARRGTKKERVHAKPHSQPRGIIASSTCLCRKTSCTRQHVTASPSKHQAHVTLRVQTSTLGSNSGWGCSNCLPAPAGTAEKQHALATAGRQDDVLQDGGSGEV